MTTKAPISRNTLVFAMLAAVAGQLLLAVPTYAADSSASPATGDRGWQVSGYGKFGFSSNGYRNVLANRESVSFGGALEVKTPVLDGFRAVAAAYTAQPLGLDPNDPSRNFITLPGRSFTTVGQAYLQYAKYGADVKVGRQSLSTPLANSADYQMIPMFFEGASAEYTTSVKGLSFYANRIFRFEPYSAHFGRGDTGSQPDPWLTTPAVKVPSVDSSGFATAGAAYKRKLFDVQTWYYHMYRRLNISYTEVNVTSPKPLFGQVPFAGIQYAREWSGRSVAPLYRDADAYLYGLKLGVKNRVNTFFVAYVSNPVRNGAARGGGFMSPYQAGIYNGSPIFTIQPTMGFTTSEQPGYAVAIRDVIHVSKISVALGYTQLHLKPATPFIGPKLNRVNSNGRFVAVNWRPTKVDQLRLVLNRVSAGTIVPGSLFATRLFYTHSF